MRLTNFWWLLIWLFLFGSLSYLFIPQQTEMIHGRPAVRWKWASAALLALPYVIWAAWRSDFYGDTGMYRNTFLKMPTGFAGFISYVSSRPKGKLFVIFEYLFKTLVSHSDVAFFFVVAFIQLFFLIRFFRKYSANYWLSMFLFVASTDYLSWMHNGIRQFLAVTLIFTCLPLLTRKKYVLMCVVLLAATLIHSTALVFLPFVFVINGRAWNKRTLLYILALVVAIIFLDHVSDFIVRAMEDTAYEGDIDIFLADDGTNIVRVLFYAVPTVMAWVFRSYIDRANDPMINICVNLSVISSGVYVLSYFTSGILVGAIPIYFSLANYVLIPWLLEEVFESRSKAFLEMIFLGVYTAFFYYQCGPTWGLL